MRIITAQWRMQSMSSKMPVKNIMTKLLKRNGVTTYAFWKAMNIGQNTAYRLCNDPDSIPVKRIMDKIHEVYGWLPGDYLVSDSEWDTWIESLPSSEKEEVLNIAESYRRKTKDGRIRKDDSTGGIKFSRYAA